MRASQFHSSYNPALALDAADGVIDGKFFGARIFNAGQYQTAYNPALALDAADGVIDGKFFGARIMNSGASYAGASYPIQRSYSLPVTSGMLTNNAALALDAADGVIDGKFFGARIVNAGQYHTAYNPALALDAADGVIDGKFFGSRIVGAAPVYKTPMVSGFSGIGLTGALGGLSTGAYPVSYPAQSSLTHFGFGAAHLAQQYPVLPAFTPIYQCAMETAPLQFIETAPAVQLIEAPPVVLQLPAPLPPPPAPLPPPPSVIHIKEDNGPKIASLQAEIRRLERLLSTAKETEAALRAEIQELYVKIEMWSRKDMQTGMLEAELARLREQLLEAQRRIVFLEGQRDEAHKHIAFLEAQLKAADAQIAQMAARIRSLEIEISNLRARLEVKQELHSRTNVYETYKVKTFEMAAKLAVMDGTDDGMYNGLPIEVEGQGLYKDLVASGRRPRENVSLTGRPASVTTTSETYKVQSFDMAEKLAKMNGLDDGRYNGLPIEVQGEGLYTDLVRAGRRSIGSTRTSTSIPGTTTTIAGQTYKVATLDMAAKISKMGGADDGTYKGLPIEVQGLGLYKDVRGRR